MSREARSRESLRRLSPDLRIVEERLTAWAAWSRSCKHRLGYPAVSSIARAIEGGQYGAIVSTGNQLIECPEPVAQIDKLVARLPDQHRRAIVANYTAANLPREVRARMAKLSLAGFQRALEMGRWQLRFALVALDAMG
jgi:hypothetical protein